MGNRLADTFIRGTGLVLIALLSITSAPARAQENDFCTFFPIHGCAYCELSNCGAYCDGPCDLLHCDPDDPPEVVCGEA